MLPMSRAGGRIEGEHLVCVALAMGARSRCKGVEASRAVEVSISDCNMLPMWLRSVRVALTLGGVNSKGASALHPRR